MAGVRQIVTREPIGPVLALSPWNWPLMTATRKLAPALAAGCSVILKPAEETPSGAVALVKILMESGLPDGVVNVVYGIPGHISGRLIRSSHIQFSTLDRHPPRGRCEQHAWSLARETGGLSDLTIRKQKPPMPQRCCDAPRRSQRSRMTSFLRRTRAA